MLSRTIFVCECLKQFKVVELRGSKVLGRKLEIGFQPDATSVSHGVSRHDDDDDQTIKFDHVAGPYDFKKKLHHEYRFRQNYKIQHNTVTDHIDEMESALDGYNPRGKELAKLRHQLFLKSANFLIEENLSVVLKALIRVASLQVAIDGHDSEQNVGELNAAKYNLTKLVDSKRWPGFYSEISTMIEGGGSTVLRELARRIETLVISLDVALSKYSEIQVPR